MALGGLNETKGEEKVINLEEAKERRKPFHVWEVAGKEYKLKLKTAQISKLENKYKCNIMKLVEDIPPLDVMLTIVQAAMYEWEHGMKFEKLQDIFDQYIEDGGSQVEFYTDVIIPILSVSGFFTVKMEQSMKEASEEL